MTTIDLEILKHHDESVRPRALIELRIVRKLIRALKRNGYSIAFEYDDEEQPMPVSSMDETEALKELFQYDDVHLDVTKNGSRSFVRLIFGECGWDVINDHGISLTAIIDPIIDAEAKRAGQ